MCRVSVIIPTYNRAQLVPNAVESVLKQTHRDFELIIVDDGSTDNTEEVIGNFSDSRLRYFKQQNQGVSAARNTGLQMADGELVAFLDSDDLFMPQKLSKQVALVESHPLTEVVYSRFYYLQENGQVTIRGRCYSTEKRYFPFGPKIHLSTMLVKREWLERVGGFDEQLTVAEDAELVWRLNAAGCRLVGVKEPLVLRRKWDNSLADSRHLHIDDMLTFVDKIFDDPRMPSEYLEHKEIARAKQLVNAAASAYLAGDQVRGRKLINRAFAMSDRMTADEIEILVRKFNSFLISFSNRNAMELLQLAVGDLAGSRLFRRKVTRTMLGHFHLTMAFRNYQGGAMVQCRRHLLQAIMYRHRFFLNRGVLSIFLRSLGANWLSPLSPTPEQEPDVLEHEELLHVLQTLNKRARVDDQTEWCRS